MYLTITIYVKPQSNAVAMFLRLNVHAQDKLYISAGITRLEDSSKLYQTYNEISANGHINKIALYFIKSPSFDVTKPCVTLKN